MGTLSPVGELEVQTFTLDEVVSRENLPLLDVIKMDFEGAEASALRGSAEVLLSRPIIFLATHGERVREECKILESFGHSMDLIESDSEFIAQQTDSSRQRYVP